jgi:hypothetical protein
MSLRHITNITSPPPTLILLILPSLSSTQPFPPSQDPTLLLQPSPLSWGPSLSTRQSTQSHRTTSSKSFKMFSNLNYVHRHRPRPNPSRQRQSNTHPRLGSPLRPGYKASATSPTPPRSAHSSKTQLNKSWHSRRSKHLKRPRTLPEGMGYGHRLR